MSSMQFHIPYSITTEQCEAIANCLTQLLGSKRVSFFSVTDSNGTKFIATDTCYVSGLRLARMRAFLDGAQTVLHSRPAVEC